MARGKYFWLISCTVVFFTIAEATTAQSCKGCLNLDEHSFKKIIPRFKYALIKYDIAYPYGAKHDAFVQFSEELASVHELIVGEVGIKDYGQMENEAFAKTQDVDAKKLPIIKLYMGMNQVATLSQDDVSVEKLRDFIRDNSDVHITLPGCIEELDKLAAEFTRASTKDLKEKQLKKVEEYKTEVEGEKVNAKAYLLYMKRLLDDSEFVEKEHKRLKKILAEGKLAEGKKLDLQQKLNILHSFENKLKRDKKDKQEL